VQKYPSLVVKVVVLVLSMVEPLVKQLLLSHQ
jgi:hypothetical protein